MRPPEPKSSAQGGGAPLVHREGPHDAIVIKPAGLSVERPDHAGRGGAGAEVRDTRERPERSLLDWARARWPHAQPRLPHRLDRMARGIVVVALTPEAASFHAAAVRERRWTKLYLARVAVDGSEGSAAGLVGHHRVYLRTRGRRAEVVRSGGDVAEMEVLAVAPVPGSQPRRGLGRTSAAGHQFHVVVRLITGRHHQIRATLAHREAPIAGDPLYDPQAGRRQGPPYLEHALLRLPRVDASDASADEVVWRRDDPLREAVDPSLLELISRFAASPGR